MLVCLVNLVNEEMDSVSRSHQDELSLILNEMGDVNSRLERLYDAIETGKVELDDLAPRIRQLRTRQEQLQDRRIEIENMLSDRKVELADLKTVRYYVNDLHNLLSESPLTERRAFIRSFVKEVKVTGDEALLTYTMPLPPEGITNEKAGVLPTVQYGGPSDPIAQPQIKTFFEVSLVSSE